MRIAIFGGTFDPVHTEHIRVAEAAIETLALDRLLVMPAHTPPHKQDKILSSDADRLALCRLAFSDVERAEISDYEIARGGTSYTYLTCEHFRAQYPDAELFWLVGTDMLRDFPTWKHTEKILNAVTLAVCARNEKADWLKKEKKGFREKFGVDFVTVGYNGADVSSTKIRILAGAGMDLTAFVEEKTAAYIREKNLYRIENADLALALEKPSRREHSIRVAEAAAKRAAMLGVSEKRAVTAALFHDCGKNIALDDPLLSGFSLSPAWGEVPQAVLHQFTGAYLAETAFGISDPEILDAIRYHTSGRAEMSALEKLIFLADMIEDARIYDGVETLRELFYQPHYGADGLDKCLETALLETIAFLRRQGNPIYPLTEKAYEYYRKEKE